MRPLRLALIDGPLGPDDPALDHAVRLRPGDGPHSRAHAAAMRAAILAGCPEARLLSLAVFGDRLATDAATIAAALDMAAALGAGLALCAFGMARPDPGLAAACTRLAASGCAIVAAAPARGGPAYPASLPGVVSVQGDARCGPDQWSRLGPPAAADWGACPQAQGHEPAAGASTAAAHFAGRLAAALADSPSLDAALEHLRQTASFHGRERRTG